MGLYIPYMEMPKSCLHCQMSIPPEAGGILDLYCCLLDEYTDLIHKERLPDCPLICLPDEFVSGEQE